MRIELRQDEKGDYVLIDGYVNAVGRDSKILHDERIGDFVEMIMPGAFDISLKRNYKVDVLLNHDITRKITDTTDSDIRLFEDNIGLRFTGKIRDEDIKQKALDNRLVGWSFGFYVLEERMEYRDGKTPRRLVESLDLEEVSILDDTKTPAYFGTSIEVRADDNKPKETRCVNEGNIVIFEDIREKREEPKPENDLPDNGLIGLKEIIELMDMI